MSSTHPCTRYAALLRFATALTIGIVGCGGADGGTPPTPTVDNAVSRIDVTPAGSLSLVSGATSALVAQAFTKDNRSLGSSGVSWTSSSDAVASVNGGLVTAKLAGTATISATSGNVSSAGVNVVVSPGVAATLGIRTQPAGASSGAPMGTQPVIEVRDAGGNLISSSSASVTVAMTSGDGVLSGSTAAQAVGGVATFSNLAIAGLVGSRTLTFSAPNLTSVSSAPLTLAPGVPAQLLIAAQPAGGTAYTPFATPAQVGIRDASGNLTTSTATISAAIASGGGTLGGTTSLPATAGSATFTSLTVNGTAGPRTLAFSSSGLATVTSASFNIASAPPAVIGLSATAQAFNAAVGTNPAAVNVNVANTGVFPLTNLRVQAVTYSPASPGNWLTISFPSGVDAPATLRLTVTSATLPAGSYSAVAVVAGDGAQATATLTVNLTVLAPTTNAFGTPSNKVSIVAIGSTLSPGLVTTSGGAVTTTDQSVSYASRAATVAAVDATGRITARAAGQAWIVASSAQNNADSVLVIVPAGTGPILKTDLTKYNYRVGDTVTARVLLDTRGATVGVITATVSWPVWTGTGQFGLMTYLDISPAGAAMSPVYAVDQAVNVIRINGASANGATGVVQLATVRFILRSSGIAGVYLNASELLALDFSSLLGSTSFAQYPITTP